MRTIENYDDFVAAMKDKSSDDRVVRNEAKNALGNFHIKYPEKYDKFKARYEGIKEPEIVIPVIPRALPQYESAPQQKKPRKTKADKEQFIKDHPELNVQKLRKEARERLLKGTYCSCLSLELPKWVTGKDVLLSLDQMELADLITASGKIATYESLKKKCIKRAAADGRIDETKLRQTILTQCANFWQKSNFKPDYPFESVKWFVLKVATVEELAIANTGYGTNIHKIIDIIFDKRIPKLNIPELREKDRIGKKEQLKSGAYLPPSNSAREEKIKILKAENPSIIKKLAKKACNYIEKHNKANDGYPFPDDFDIENLKASIDKISEDELWTIFDGKRVNADALYTLCIEVIGNSEQNERN